MTGTEKGIILTLPSLLILTFIICGLVLYLDHRRYKKLRAERERQQIEMQEIIERREKLSKTVPKKDVVGSQDTIAVIDVNSEADRLINLANRL